MIWLKSKLYREELTYWCLIVILSIWGMTTTVFALRNTQKTILIGIDEAGARVISDSKDRLLQVELKQFLKYFLDQYYTYSAETFTERVGLATELMSADLWEREKAKLSEIKVKLEQMPLSQFSELESIDLVDQNKVEASLERNSKRILIEFKKFRDPQARDTYSISASAMDYKGVLGLKGSVVSNEETYFAAEFLAAGAAGYADSTIQRDQNVYGNSVENRSSDTFAKKALVVGLSKTAERFSEKLKQAPEYSVLEGPIQIQILIQEQPTITQ